MGPASFPANRVPAFSPTYKGTQPLLLLTQRPGFFPYLRSTGGDDVMVKVDCVIPVTVPPVQPVEPDVHGWLYVAPKCHTYLLGPHTELSVYLCLVK